jgi:hypothetical protein
MLERDKIIKYNKAFIKKNKKIPPTSLEYYKFVKVISIHNIYLITIVNW